MIKNIIFILALVLFFVIALRHMERRSLYIPYRVIEQTPEALGLKFNDVSLDTADHEKINGWWIPKNGAALTLFFLHGNGGNLSHRIEKISFFNGIGFNVFIIDYRGYGKSSGAPSEAGLYLDAECGYDYLTKALGIQPKNIILYGESLGGAVAINLACKKPVKGLILEGTFTNVEDMARTIIPFVPGLFFSSKFDSTAKISDLKIPKLIIHSRNDEVVPYEFSLRLFNAASEPKEFLEISGGHNEAFYLNKDEIKNRINTFIHEK